MIYGQDAKRIVSETEAGLRDLMKKAVDAQQYTEVAVVAALADGLATLLRSGAPRAAFLAPANGLPKKSVVRRAATERTPTKTKSPSKRDYPRFQRDGDRLVKIGWSKKEKRVYEHRAPKQVVFSVASQLATGVTPHQVFTMEQFLPFHDGDGQEIPAYQAYLVLAWLRSIELVERKGKDGYLISQGGALEHTNIHRAWEAIGSR